MTRTWFFYFYQISLSKLWFSHKSYSSHSSVRVNSNSDCRVWAPVVLLSLDTEGGKGIFKWNKSFVTNFEHKLRYSMRQREKKFSAFQGGCRRRNRFPKAKTDGKGDRETGSCWEVFSLGAQTLALRKASQASPWLQKWTVFLESQRRFIVLLQLWSKKSAACVVPRASHLHLCYLFLATLWSASRFSV